MRTVLHPALWSPENAWLEHFPLRANLRAELALLDQAFPHDWRQTTFGRATPSLHPLRGHLTLPGRTRLLDLAAGLLHEGAGPVSTEPCAEWRIPMRGRLRNRKLFQPTVSELLVGPLLRHVGDVMWQPPRKRGRRADYLVRHRGGALVAEVKCPRNSDRYEELSQKRTRELDFQSLAAEPMKPLLTDDDRDACLREEADRFYGRVRDAAEQLRGSAEELVGVRRAAGVPGVLFLDVQDNVNQINLRKTLHRWMKLDWAGPIDLVVCFYYASHGGRTGIVAEAAYRRRRTALEAIFGAHPLCREGHIHLGGMPPGGHCPIPFGV